MAGRYQDTIEASLELILDRLNSIQEEMKMARADFDAAMADLQAKVKHTSDVEEAALALIQGIASQLADAITASDIDAIKAISDKLNAEADALAAAVAANSSAPPPTA